MVLVPLVTLKSHNCYQEFRLQYLGGHNHTDDKPTSYVDTQCYEIIKGNCPHARLMPLPVYDGYGPIILKKFDK